MLYFHVTREGDLGGCALVFPILPIRRLNDQRNIQDSFGHDFHRDVRCEFQCDVIQAFIAIFSASKRARDV